MGQESFDGAGESAPGLSEAENAAIDAQIADDLANGFFSLVRDYDDILGDRLADPPQSAPRYSLATQLEEATLDKANESLSRKVNSTVRNIESGIEVKITQTTIRKLVSNAAALKSVENGFTYGQHNAMAANVDTLFAKSRQVVNRPDKAGDANVKSIRRFAALGEYKNLTSAETTDGIPVVASGGNVVAGSQRVAAARANGETSMKVSRVRKIETVSRASVGDALKNLDATLAEMRREQTRFSLGMRETLDPVAWGDLSRKVKVVGDGKLSWNFVNGKSMKDAKSEIATIATANLKAQENYIEVGEGHTPALKIGNVIFKIPIHNLFHGAARNIKSYGQAAAIIGDVMNASVEIPNVESPWHYYITSADFGTPCYVLVTATEAADGTKNVVDMQTLYSVNTKTSDAARGLNHTNTTRLGADIVSNLRDAWQDAFLPGIVRHNVDKILADNASSPALQYEAVVEKYRNTDKWLKAPNGNSSKLGAWQWLQVRTEDFRNNYFGDWLNLLRGNMLKSAIAIKVAKSGTQFSKPSKAAVEEAVKWIEGIGSQTFNTEVGDLLFDRKSVKDSLEHAPFTQSKFDAVFSIPEGFKNAVYLGTFDDFEGNTITNHYFAYPVEYDGERQIVFCRARENADRAGLYVHDIFVEQDIKDEAPVLPPDITALKAEIAQGVYRDSELMRSILKVVYGVNGADVSKVVDENGEPLVVYRGASFDPLKQPSGKGIIKPEAYFSPSAEYAKRYGDTNAYFLNIRNPFDIRRAECEDDFHSVYPAQNPQRGISGALDWAEASTIDGEFLEENSPENTTA